MNLFMFSHLNPLNNTAVENVRSCEIINDTVFLQVLNEQGKTEVIKVRKTQFIMTQIEQFQIPIEANL